MDDILTSLKKAGRHAFRTREYSNLLSKGAYARLVLHRLKLKNEIISIKNGWWAFADSSLEAIACEISKPAYVSFHSALFLHGLTTQVPRCIQIATTRKTKKYSVCNIKVIEFKIPKKSFNNFYSKNGVLLASKNKAFADCISLPRSCPDIILYEALDDITVDEVRSFLYTAQAQKRLKRVLSYVKQKRG